MAYKAKDGRVYDKKETPFEYSSRRFTKIPSNTVKSKEFKRCFTVAGVIALIAFILGG